MSALPCFIVMMEGLFKVWWPIRCTW